MVYIFPKTRLGKISVWLGISGLLVIILLNVIADVTQCPEGICTSSDNETGIVISIVLGWMAIGSILISGMISLFAIIKKHDHAILLLLPVFIGIMGVFFILGEIFIPH